MYDSLNYSTELCHHGILGQRWGIRRYQNPDGSLTEAGRKKYGYNLDVNNTDRQNVAKIRLGEAKRRLDYSKLNGSSNTRKAELQGRVRTAKRLVKDAKRYDKGALRAAKGETISGNNKKAMYTAIGAAAAGRVLTSLLNKRLSTIKARDGFLARKTVNQAAILNVVGSMAISGAAIAYGAKKMHDNKNLRAFQRMQWSGQGSIKGAGSQEYAYRKEHANKSK